LQPEVVLSVDVPKITSSLPTGTCCPLAGKVILTKGRLIDFAALPWKVVVDNLLLKDKKKDQNCEHLEIVEIGHMQHYLT